MKLKNVTGTSGLTCNCDSWLEHWKKFSGRTLPMYCPISGCLSKDLVGAHVRKAEGDDRKTYIAPICTAHNQLDGVMDMPDWYELVPADPGQTCKRA